MLRVGLTGELGSGKSTVARMLAERGAIVLSSDEMARAMMQPGERVYAQIVERFGHSIVRQGKTLDRGMLARLAFDPEHTRIEELNAIVHPAVIAEQAAQIAVIARAEPHAIVIVESALLFSTRHMPSGGWRERFDCIVLLTANDETKIARFVERTVNARALSAEERHALEEDARQRLARQHFDVQKTPGCMVLHNDGDLRGLERQVDALWQELLRLERNRAFSASQLP
jgi:dephospho-CoA kinase